MQINQKKAGVLISYLAQGVQILSGLLYTPIMLRLLGQNEYGLYQLVASVVSYLSILSLGFESSYIRFYSRIKKKGDEEAVAKFNAMFMAIFLVIAVVCLLCGVVMLSNIKLVFGDGLTQAEYDRAKILLALMIFNLALTFPESVFDSFMSAQEQFLFQKFLRLLQYLFHPFITLPLLLLGYGSVSMVLVATALTIGKMIASSYYCLKKLHIRMIFRDFQFGLLKEMWVFTFFIFINMIVDQINWSVDKFLLGRFGGTVAVAIYGVASQLNSMYLQVSTTISNVFIPQVNRIVVETDDNRELTELFTKVGRIQFILLSLIVTGFFFFGKSFIPLWAGEEYADSYLIALLLIISVTVPLVQNLGIEIQRAKNMHKVRSIIYLGIAISNVFISVPFIKLWGAIGAAVGTAVSLVAGNCIFMNIYYYKKVGLDVLYFWKEIFKFIPALTIPIFSGIIIWNHWKMSNWGTLLLGIMMYTFVFCCSMWFLGMNEREKNMLSYPLQRVWQKTRKNS